MEYFEKYVSNTIAGSGNQTYFLNCNADEVKKGRVFYKITVGGKYQYSLLFSNVIDSTFGDGTHSHCNLIVDEWTITEAKVGISAECHSAQMVEPKEMKTLTFEGKTEKAVAPGEFFYSDPISLSFEKDEYLCLEITFKGKMIPFHEESILPSFLWDEKQKKWVLSKLHPFAAMIGCDRPVKKKIAFLGDSITQGIGVAVNSYEHWNAVVAENLGSQYGFWNLGLGYGRAADAATDGAWLFKAKQNDIVVVCYGVNDIFQGFTVSEIQKNLKKIIDILHANGVKVILQNVPPFDYSEKYLHMWHEVNKYIREELYQKADLFFDCAEYLKKSDEEPHLAPYGGHPNSEGCKIWGDNLSRVMLDHLTF